MHILRNGYRVTHVEGTLAVNGELGRGFVDHDDKTVVVADDGCSRSELVRRTCEAVDETYAPAPAAESVIEVLHGLTFRRVPIIPPDEPRLPFAQ